MEGFLLLFEFLFHVLIIGWQTLISRTISELFGVCKRKVICIVTVLSCMIKERGWKPYVSHLFRIAHNLLLAKAQSTSQELWVIKRSRRNRQVLRQIWSIAVT